MKILKNLEKANLLLIVFLLPLFVLPVFPNLYYPAKLALLVFGMGAWLVIRAIRSTAEGKIEFSHGKFDLPVIAFAAAYLLSAAITTPNKMEAFFLPGTATIVAISALLYFALNSEVDHKSTKGALLASGVVLAIVSLMSASGITRSLPLADFTQTDSLNLIGGTLPLAIFLLVLLPFSISWTFSTKQAVNKIFLGVVSFLLLFGLMVSIYGNVAAAKNGAVFQSLATSWSVTVDTLKESPILGSGPANYLTVFNRFRPVSYNQTPLWNTRFNSGHDFYLTTITETGLVGLAALVILLTQVVKELSSQTNRKAEVLSMGLLLLAGLFFPLSPVLLTLLFILLALCSGTKETKNIYPRFPILLVTLPVIVAVIFLGYLAVGYLKAEAYFNNALKALKINDGKKTYEEVGLAIKTNPYVDRYHITRSQVALALANALAGKKNLTEEEKNSVAQLIQQSITEAKAAVTLNPSRAANWELLAKNYQAIISFAKGSDQFAIQTYSQAIALDPTNPILRIELGGVYYAQGNYDLAIDTFKLAVLAKADYANAHYNLAIALREKKEYTKAIEEMKTVLTLVDKNSKDYELAKAELDSLEKKKADTKEISNTETLTQPEKQTQTNTQVELPSDSTPPQAEGVPTPTP